MILDITPFLHVTHIKHKLSAQILLVSLCVHYLIFNISQFLRPDKIIPTVNVWNAASREKMQSFFREWLSCKKLMI